MRWTPFARMLTHEASVLRDGRRLTVPVESLVVGDVVLAEAGDRIPADLRLSARREPAGSRKRC